MRPVMPANVIDEPSASRRSVGLQLFLNHKNLWVDSDEEEERRPWVGLVGRLCAGRHTLVKDRCSVARDRCSSPEAIYLWNNYERTVESWIFITACAQHSFLIHISLEMKCSGCGWGQEGRGTACSGSPEIFPLSLLSNPLAVFPSLCVCVSKPNPTLSPEGVPFWSVLRRTQVFSLLGLQIKASFKGAQPSRGFPGSASGKEPACQCKRCKRLWFDLWVGKIPWRRAWQATPVFLPGESHGQRSLVGYSSWGCKRVRHDCPTNTGQPALKA